MEDTPGARAEVMGRVREAWPGLWEVRLAGGEARVDCGYLEDMLRIWGHPGPTGGGGHMVLFLRQGRVCSPD